MFKKGGQYNCFVFQTDTKKYKGGIVCVVEATCHSFPFCTLKNTMNAEVFLHFFLNCKSVSNWKLSLHLLVKLCTG